MDASNNYKSVISIYTFCMFEYINCS